MPDILELISDADRLDFSQNISVARPAYLGDRLFPDQKTESLKAEYLRLANGAQIPTMATVHAFDTEAEIATRPALEKTEVEKLFIKRKINQSERVQLLNENGVYADNAIVSYVFDDMRLMADAVKVRTEVAKMEVIATGKMTIKENNLNMTVDYGVPSANIGFKIDFGADADIIGQLQAIADQAAASGHALSEMVVGTKILRKLASNKGIQTSCTARSALVHTSPPRSCAASLPSCSDSARSRPTTSAIRRSPQTARKRRIASSQRTRLHSCPMVRPIPSALACGA